jgi:hypothetical protein
MGRKSYPQWGGDEKIGRKEECGCCSRRATHVVGVEWSYMRGEDSHVPACSKHREMAETNFRRFLAHLDTKDKWVASLKKPPADQGGRTGSREAALHPTDPKEGNHAD